MIKDILEEIVSINETEKIAHLARLAETPETSLKELVNILQQPAKHLWPIALQAVHAIGYPQNSSVLPLVMDHLVDGNWPGWDDAINVLTSVNPIILAPLFIEILLDRGKKREQWSDDVEGICAALPHMRKEYTIPCIPSILSLLISGLDEPDPDFLLRALEHAEIQRYAYALPSLIHVLEVATREEIKAYAGSLIRLFPLEDLEFYKGILPLDGRN
jgi:hypothetical protein